MKRTRLTSAHDRLAGMLLDQAPAPLLLVLAGSHAHGTAHTGSDLDLWGVHPGARTYRRSTEDGDVALYDLRGFLTDAAAGNPARVEVLHSPLLAATAGGEILREHRERFITARLVHALVARVDAHLASADRGRLTNGMPINPTKARYHALRMTEQVRILRAEGQFAVTVPDADALKTTAENAALTRRAITEQLQATSLDVPLRDPVTAADLTELEAVIRASDAR